MENEQEDKIEREFRNLLELMSDEQFWKWVGSWYDEQMILDVCNSWDADIKYREIKNMKEICK